MCVYLCTKFEASSIILMSFRQGRGVYPPPPGPTSKQPLKNPSRLGLRSDIYFIYSVSAGDIVMEVVSWNSHLFSNKQVETRNQKMSFSNHTKQKVKSKYEIL